ncbi:MAG: MarR family transcriptional regulator, partial [Oscillospiraceae bacterium]|nr:MarR family transcriptional regulator [Oscillospiraceae bacterium]
MREIVVIGGANVDISGVPAGRLVPRDSNPGTVAIRPGGVGRNVAQDLRLLGQRVSLLTALGGDVYGAVLRENCRKHGIDLSMSLLVPDARSSTYLYVADERGEMQLAISDMAITEQLTPEAIAPHRERLCAAAAVFVDANLPAETLRCVAGLCTAPLYADPVSAAKAPRLAGILDRLAAVKP